MAMTNLGSGQFFKATGATNPQVRVAEALGVIKPIKSGSGWRQFTQADVAAMKAWLTQQRSKARR
jgi:DNA-binding transcriptional MerR regulator